ncbi:MAG: PEGA domain-containing protein [Archangiaceae bacterium]|nr:PEGA domain-containing protein [Archangiaceae bacterium]
MTGGGPSLDEALATCKAHAEKLPPQLAAWLVARACEEATFDQPAMGQALFELTSGDASPTLAAIITRMVHPDAEIRYPADGRELRTALYDYVKSTHRPVSPELLAEFLSRVSATAPRESGDPLFSAGKQLDASGRVHQLRTAPPPRASPSAFEPPKMKPEELELARAPRRAPNTWSEPAPYRDEVGKKRSRLALYLALGLAVLGASATAAFILYPSLQRKVPLPSLQPARALLITSEPAGATILIEGKAIGVTPWAGDNRWGGKVRLELRRDGYEPFRDTFQGGKDQSIGATLKPKPR